MCRQSHCFRDLFITLCVQLLIRAQFIWRLMTIADSGIAHSMQAAVKSRPQSNKWHVVDISLDAVTENYSWLHVKTCRVRPFEHEILARNLTTVMFMSDVAISKGCWQAIHEPSIWQFVLLYTTDVACSPNTMFLCLIIFINGVDVIENQESSHIFPEAPFLNVPIAHHHHWHTTKPSRNDGRKKTSRILSFWERVQIQNHYFRYLGAYPDSPTAATRYITFCSEGNGGGRCCWIQSSSSRDRGG